MKLRLDEMVPVRVARELRAEGFDVDAVVEIPGLRGLPDALQLARAAVDRRALVSYDAGDLVALASQRTASGDEHAGLVLLPSRRFPQGSPDLIVEGLRRFLTGEQPAAGFIHWLEAITDAP